MTSVWMTDRKTVHIQHLLFVNYNWNLQNSMRHEFAIQINRISQRIILIQRIDFQPI